MRNWIARTFGVEDGRARRADRKASPVIEGLEVRLSLSTMSGTRGAGPRRDREKAIYRVEYNDEEQDRDRVRTTKRNDLMARDLPPGSYRR